MAADKPRWTEPPLGGGVAAVRDGQCKVQRAGLGMLGRGAEAGAGGRGVVFGSGSSRWCRRGLQDGHAARHFTGTRAHAAGRRFAVGGAAAIHSCWAGLRDAVLTGLLRDVMNRVSKWRRQAWREPCPVARDSRQAKHGCFARESGQEP